MMTGTPVLQIPPLGREEEHTLAATEYQRLIGLLQSLTAEDWRKPTDCDQWDVRAVAGHCVGMMSDFTSLRAVLRRVRAATSTAKRAGGPMIDSMTAMQVEDHAGLSTHELVAKAEAMGPAAAAWRTSRPALLRMMPMKESVAGRPETWRLGYLLATILTRDPWMHRIDIARATGRDLVLTPEHDGRIVADVVAEWARRHQQPFVLRLTGSAGGEFIAGAGGEQLTIDAVEFCRILSGRATGIGLLAQQVPF